MTGKTHFGYQEVDATEKAHRVAGVFDSVAPNYDLMNDLMSAGMHRAWKAFTIALAGVRAGEHVLDVASGSGDLASAFARRVGPEGQVWLTDINGAMLARGRDRVEYARDLVRLFGRVYLLKAKVGFSVHRLFRSVAAAFDRRSRGGAGLPACAGRLHALQVLLP
jgi:SAM-dependent methyltransferase